MTVARSSDLIRTAGDHASRPAATAVPVGALYSCTTHSLIYRSDGAAWSTWATLGAGGTALLVANNLSDLASAATARTNLGLGTAAVVDTGTTTGKIPLLSTGGLLPIARIASGTPDGTKFVRDDGTLATPAGGGGSSPVDLLYTAPSGVTSIDEFNDATISGWTQIDTSGAASKVTWVESGDALSAYLTGTDSSSVLHAQMRAVGTALAAGDALVTCFNVTGPDGAMPGSLCFPAITVADGVTVGSGNQLLAAAYNGAWEIIESWTGYNSGTGTLAQTTMSYGAAHRLWLRLVKLASNVWRVDYSPNGSQWFVSTNTLTWANTPTHIGLSCFSTSSKAIVTFETFRRMSGVS